MVDLLLGKVLNKSDKFLVTGHRKGQVNFPTFQFSVHVLEQLTSTVEKVPWLIT